eukprot:scaffold5851_cov115-Skeletonema_marinoi.AAC.2
MMSDQDREKVKRQREANQALERGIYNIALCLSEEFTKEGSSNQHCQMDIEAKVTVKLRIGIQLRAAEATTNESEMYIRHGGPPS